MELETIISALRSKGERITPASSALLEVLFSAKIPLTYLEIMQGLKERGITINKTTIYRQLEKLVKQRVVSEVQLNERTKRFEVAGEKHHHHLVCGSCGNIEDISFPSDLEKQEKDIEEKNKFKVERHSLEFFGVCRNCR